MTLRGCVSAVTLLAVAMPSVALGQAASWRLVAEWRIGGEPDGPYSFDDVLDLEWMPGNRIVVFDRGLLQMHVYDTTGRAIRTIGRRGGGPGEFASPRGVAVAPDGRLVVLDGQLARLSILRPTGEYERGVSVMRRHPYWFDVEWDGSFDRAGRFLMSVGIRPAPVDGVQSGLDSTMMTERWAPDFSASDSVSLCSAPPPSHLHPAKYEVRSRGRPGGPPGGFAVNREIPYSIAYPYYVRDLDGYEWGPREYGSGELVRRESGKCGDVVARVVLSGPRPPLSDRLRDSILQRVPNEHHDRVPHAYPWYWSLRVDDRNNLWVEREAAGGRVFEVFDTRGRAVAVAPVPPALIVDEAPGPAHVVIAHGRVYGLVQDADDVRYLAAWRITAHE